MAEIESSRHLKAPKERVAPIDSVVAFVNKHESDLMMS